MGPGFLFASRYRIVRRLGAGAMGAVYEVVDGRTESARALKVMHPHILDRPDLYARFRTEATVAGSVGSPFLMDVLDAGIDEPSATPYLVMELLRGEDLGRRLARSGPMALDEALPLLAQLAAGLTAMHRAGVVHRDLKPSNLFLEERPPEPARLKILDFGIAKILGDGACGESATTAGTPLYMAPEQFGGRAVTAATDIHALGMIAFTMLAGSAYWEEPGRESLGLMAFARVASKGPVEAATLRAARRGVELPPAFDGWFQRITARSPRGRFASANEAVSALAGALGQELSASAAPLLAVTGLATGTPSAFAETFPAGGEMPHDREVSGIDETALSAEGAATVTATGSTEATYLPEIGASSPGPASGPASTGAAATPAALAKSASGTPGAARRWRRAALIVALSVAGGVAWWSGAHRPAAAPRAGSALDPPDAILACPPLQAFGAAEPSGWLGAAAAAAFCERARIVLGGRPARTLLPAELLALPPQPVDGYPADPYGVAGARERALAEARRRAAAYVDGTITRTPSGYRLAVSLRRSDDGAEIDRAVAESPALYGAVRTAMDRWLSAGSLPHAERLDPVIAEYSRAKTIDDALLLSDVSFAMIHNAGTLSDECRRLEERALALGEMGAGERYRCAYTVGRAAPEIALPPADPTSRGAVAARARVAHMIDRVDPPEVVTLLTGALAAEPAPWGKATLAATLSCLLQASDAKRAGEVALRAVQAEPKNPTGEWCAPWVQLATVAQGTPGAEAAARAMQAWAPWDGYGWLFEAQATSDLDRALAYLRRAHLLSPFDTYVASVLSDRLLAAGSRGEARGIALALSSGGQPVHQVGSELLLLRVEASEARFAAALRRALEAMLPRTGDAGWVRAQRLEIAWRALEIAQILGRSAEVADRIWAAFLEPEPPAIDVAHPEASLRLPAVCARASAVVSGRCFERFRALRSALSGGVLPGSEAFVAGAEKWARGDLRGAAEAFRPLLREPLPFVSILPEAMIEAFEAAREPEVVIALEGALPDRAAELGGASLAMVRAARRAAREGRAGVARELAHRTIAAWSSADGAVPAVEGMRQLEARGR